MNKLKTSAVALMATVLMTGGASAATCGTVLDTENVQITSIGGSSVTTINATNCMGQYAGNDVGEMGTLLSKLNSGIFAGLANDWTLFGKSDDGSGKVTVPETQTGTWSVNFALDAFSVFAVSLKGSNSYAVYLFDLRPNANSEFGGDFNMAGILNNGGNTPDLSHMTIATWDVPAVVPLPAAGWLMIGALGGLAALRRRRKAA